MKLDPAAGESHAFLGTMLRERGDLPAARVSLQCAIALLPSSAAVYVDLGITYLRAGQLDPGIGQLEAGLNVPAPAPPAPDWSAAIAALRSTLSSSAQTADAGAGGGEQHARSAARTCGRGERGRRGGVS